MSSNCQVWSITLQKFGNENCEKRLPLSINRSLLLDEINLAAEVRMDCSKAYVKKIQILAQFIEIYLSIVF